MRKDEGEFASLIIVGNAERGIALEVDEVLDEGEFVAKPLGVQLRSVRNIAGGTILNTGSVAPILNIPELLESASGMNHAPEPSETVENEREEEEATILVVEDSITARMLLKNILESAGYSVLTAVNGVEALAALEGEDVRLVVSDVDMPRMNGFVLTEKIRKEKRLAEIPVVLVTALDSVEDRERGLEVGADLCGHGGGSRDSRRQTNRTFGPGLHGKCGAAHQDDQAHGRGEGCQTDIPGGEQAGSPASDTPGTKGCGKTGL